jgi:predicted AAA+ superfamily ATPase
VLDRIVSQDLPLEFGLKDVPLLKTLLEMFCHDPGMIANVESISRDLGRNKITIGNYIEHLKYSLLIFEVKNLRGGVLASSRKNKKIYPASTAFCFAYREDFFSDSTLGKVAEAAVATHLSAQYYYLNGFEVDFVKKTSGKNIPIEVKYGAKDEGQLKKFMEKFNAKNGVLVSKDILAPGKQGICILPLWLFLCEEFDTVHRTR